MDSIVLFRDFEERDIDFIYKCKNDIKLNSMIVGKFKPFTYEEATNWVHGCMGDHETYKFWAICTNDEDRRIIGWTALSKIDMIKNSAFFHSIVIGDSKYNNGLPWIEVQRFVMDYAFNTLKIRKLEFSCLCNHPSSMSIGPVMFFKQDHIEENAIEKNGVMYSEVFFTISSEEYKTHLQAGDYEFMSILSRYAAFPKKMNGK